MSFTIKSRSFCFTAMQAEPAPSERFPVLLMKDFQPMIEHKVQLLIRISYDILQKIKKNTIHKFRYYDII